MRKYLVLLPLLAMLVLPQVSSAAIMDELRSQINTLIAKVQQLQAQLAKLQAAKQITETSTAPNVSWGTGWGEGWGKGSATSSVDGSYSASSGIRPVQKVDKDSSRDLNIIKAFTDQIFNTYNASPIGSKEYAGLSVQARANFDKKIVNMAKLRKDFLLDLAKKDPGAFLKAAISKTKRNALPFGAQNYIEKEVVVSGKITTVYVDDFKNPKNSRLEYSIKANGKESNLYLAQPLFAASGAEVSVKGFQLENALISEGGKASVQVVTNAPLPDSIGDQKTLVFLVEFLDSPSRPFTKEEAYNLTFNNQFQKFMQEQSYGKVSFSGDVYGWIRYNRNMPAINSGQVVSISDDELKNYIVSNSINLGNYDRVVYFVLADGGGLSEIGKSQKYFNGGTYNFSQTWISVASAPLGPSGAHPFNWKNIDYLLAHEMGHALGVLHSSGWDCGDQVAYGQCQHVEYGNYFDAMATGSTGYTLHFNAFYKEFLGWIPPDSSLLINQSGTYAINALESNSGINLAKIKILNSTSTSVYLEWRKGIGFDAKLNSTDLNSNQKGLLVNIVSYLNGYPIPSTRVLDMKPTAQEWWSDLKQASFDAGQTKFEDPGRGIGLIVNNVNESTASFNIELKQPQCVRQQPVASSMNVTLASGAEMSISVPFINNDSELCNPASFKLTAGSPAPWIKAINSPTSKISPQQDGFGTVNLFVPINTPAGYQEVTVVVTNIDSGLELIQKIYVNVVDPPFINSIVPAKGLPGTVVKILGSGFSLGSHIMFEQPGIGYVSQAADVKDDKTINFTIPSVIHSYECDCATTTPFGKYKVTVFANNASAVAEFEVASSNNLPPLISGVSGPTTLNVGQTGNWTVKASDPENGTLSYSVIWGDEATTLCRVAPCPVSASPVQQTPIFTHAYSKAGAYNPTFTVTDNKGLSAKASASVSVSENTTFSITLTAPNGGEKWQLGNTHTILWIPYAYEPTPINPASQVTAYLEKLVNGSFVSIGKIVACGKASIHWEGNLDLCGSNTYAAPGDYYIKVINNITGASDRSDKPFTLVAQGTLKADLKISNSDGPIVVSAGGATYTASWTSNTQACQLYNDLTGENLQNLPPSGSKDIYLIPNDSTWDKRISLSCSAKTPIEGSAYDFVTVAATQYLSVFAPNGDELIGYATPFAIKWQVNSSIINKISIALYKDDKFFKWILSDYNIIGGGGDIYIWTPANTIAINEVGDNFKIYMIGYKIGGGTVEDKSDAPFSIVAAGSNLPPVVSGVSGPTTLNVGQTGNWTVKASDPENGTLSYSVIWGDEATTLCRVAPCPVSASPVQQTPIFTHAYSKAGAYNPTFTVTDNKGLSAKASASVSVGVVTATTTPSITVLSPNGGEKWEIGKTYTVKWANTTGENVAIGLYKGGYPVGISLGAHFSTETSYNFTVPALLKSGDDYKVQINADRNVDGKFVEDYSDAPFSIVAASTRTTTSASLSQMANTLEAAKEVLNAMLKILGR